MKECDNSKIECDNSKIECDNSEIECDNSEIECDNSKIECDNSENSLCNYWPESSTRYFVNPLIQPRVPQKATKIIYQLRECQLSNVAYSLNREQFSVL
jgi:hypothetical protein